MIKEKYLNFYDSSEAILAGVFPVPLLIQFFECTSFYFISLVALNMFCKWKLILLENDYFWLDETRSHICFVS